MHGDSAACLLGHTSWPILFLSTAVFLGLQLKRTSPDSMPRDCMHGAMAKLVL